MTASNFLIAVWAVVAIMGSVLLIDFLRNGRRSPVTGVLNNNEFHLPNGQRIRNVHDAKDCAGRACVIHNPTGHHMRDWPLNWRGDRALFERTCPHGIGHPDPDQIPYWEETGQDHQLVHGCDGCCSA